MAMRYIIRRTNAEELGDVRTYVGNLDAQLGSAAEDYRRNIKVALSPVRTAQFQFLTRKAGSGWIWVCPTIELVAEDEKGLFALTRQFNAPKPSHLAHLEG